VNPSENPTADVSPAAAAELLASGAVTVVDVREPEEWTAGHFDGACHKVAPGPIRVSDAGRTRPGCAVTPGQLWARTISGSATSSSAWLGASAERG
jgi:rhodanese-related sulfurtransferase